MYNKDFKGASGGPIYRQSEKKEKGMYRRFWIIIGFTLIGYYLLTINMSFLPLLFSLLLLLLYTHYKTYHVFQFHEGLGETKYEYNRRYNIMFWAVTIIQGYIYWLLLLKPELLFMNTEVLLRLPQDLGMFVKVYSIEEKIMYLYNYFEYYIDLISNESLNKDYLRYILRQIDLQMLIDNTVSLRDLKVYVRLFIKNYYYSAYFNTIRAKYVNQNIIEEQYNINPWYILMHNVLFISTLTSTVISNKNIWLITKQIHTSEEVYRLTKDISLGTMKNKMTYKAIENIRIKLFN